jgi:hypothetical protein
MKGIFPRPAAWFSALALTVFAGLLGTTMSWFYRAGAQVFFEAPRLAGFAFFLGVLSPIVLIAFGNHTMHRVLDRMGKRETSRGALPRLMSWWAGLYGWLVLMLSAWTSVTIVMMIHPQSSFFAFYNLFRLDSGVASVLSIPTIVFVVLGAMLYQVEARVRDRVAAGPDSTT